MAEPRNIRDKFGEAEAEGHPLLDRIELDTLVTVCGAALRCGVHSMCTA